MADFNWKRIKANQKLKDKHRCLKLIYNQKFSLIKYAYENGMRYATLKALPKT